MSSSSKNVFPWLCLVTLLCVNSTQSQAPNRLCGRYLTDALDLICENGFATKTKKSIDSLYDGEGSIEFAQLPFLERTAINSLAKTRRRRHGVVDECCKKPCSLTELQSYCR